MLHAQPRYATLNGADCLRADRVQALRARLAALEPALKRQAVLPFGDARLDARLPGRGLPLGCWHEIGGSGVDGQDAAAPAAFAARLAAVLSDRPTGGGRMGGQVVWVLRRPDLYAPGLMDLGLAPGRLIVVRAPDEAQALAAVEDAIRTEGVAAVVAEIEAVDLTAGRRLQLACERAGRPVLVVRRRLFGRTAGSRPPSCVGRPEPAVAATRWRIAPEPSDPGPSDSGGVPGLGLGLGPARLRVELERARGGRTGAWVMEVPERESWERENSYGAVPFRVVAELANHTLSAGECRGSERPGAQPVPLRAAG